MPIKKKSINVVCGTKNVFDDFGIANPKIEQAKSMLAAEIIKVMTKLKLTARAAAETTGIAASELSRIRNARLDRFTIDRLMTILDQFDHRLDVRLTVAPMTRSQLRDLNRVSLSSSSSR